VASLAIIGVACTLLLPALVYLENLILYDFRSFMIEDPAELTSTWDSIATLEMGLLLSNWG
jgi:hypothetical protein